MSIESRTYTEMLIVQPTSFCNINCDYCYLPHRNDTKRMQNDVLHALFSKILSSQLIGDRLAVVWHAGEPLTLPPTWYETAFAIAELYRPPGCDIRHVFQSNGMLVNREWTGMLRHSAASISLSIDGPAWLHDGRRRTRAGQGTHAAAIRGLKLLQDAGIFPSVITVLTNRALGEADALFDFYAAHGIHDVAFNVEELEGANASSTMAGGEIEAAYRGFISRFVTRMRAAPTVLTLREWRDATSTLQHGVPDGFNQEAEPMRIVSVARDGNVSTFSPELLGFENATYGDFVFGNILTDSVDVICDRVQGSRLRRDVAAGIASCRRTCGWFDWCGGGSPSNKIFENGSAASTETAYCRLTRQALLDVVLAKLQGELAPPTAFA